MSVASTAVNLPDGFYSCRIQDGLLAAIWKDKDKDFDMGSGSGGKGDDGSGDKDPEEQDPVGSSVVSAMSDLSITIHCLNRDSCSLIAVLT